MTVEELRREAKAMGYNIIPIKPKEKLLPCACGSKRREHWSTYEKGKNYTVLRCEKCGRGASGRTEREARRNWNDMVRGDSDGNN